MRSIGYPNPKDSTPPYRHDPEMAARVANARHNAGKVLARYREAETRPRDRVAELEQEVEQVKREAERIVALVYELQARIDLPF